MPGNNLTTSSSILCPHGGMAILMTANTKVTAGGAPVLLESDTHLVAGCAFTAGPVYSPCLTIAWSGGTTQVTVDGAATLVMSSIGLCKNAAGAPQGAAVIANAQPRVTSQ